MTTLTLDTDQASLLDTERPAPAPAAGRAASRPASAARAGRSLDDLVAGAWETLAVTQTAHCPFCGGDLVPRFGAGPHAVAGACRSCGAELS
jgi:hypothetical protein